MDDSIGGGGFAPGSAEERVENRGELRGREGRRPTGCGVSVGVMVVRFVERGKGKTNLQLSQSAQPKKRKLGA